MKFLSLSKEVRRLSGDGDCDTEDVLVRGSGSCNDRDGSVGDDEVRSLSRDGDCDTEDVVAKGSGSCNDKDGSGDDDDCAVLWRGSTARR